MLPPQHRVYKVYLEFAIDESFIFSFPIRVKLASLCNYAFEDGNGLETIRRRRAVLTRKIEYGKNADFPWFLADQDLEK